jgi:hypothetical protein
MNVLAWMWFAKRAFKVSAVAMLAALASACSATPNPLHLKASLQSKIEFDGVVLSWAELRTPVGEQSGTLERGDVYLRVERELVGTDKWDLLSQHLLPTATEFKDERIAPHVRYRYRLAACDRNDNVVGRSPSHEVTTIDPYRVSFLACGRNSAEVRIDALEVVTGRTYSITHTHAVGDRIGWWVNEGDETRLPSSRHQVTAPSGGQTAVDFSTGLTITKIEWTTKTIPVLMCSETCGQGGPIGCKKVLRDTPVTFCTLTYSKDGQETIAIDPQLEAEIAFVKEISACPLHRSK